MTFKQYLYTFVARPKSLMENEALMKSTFDVSSVTSIDCDSALGVVWLQSVEFVNDC